MSEDRLNALAVLSIEKKFIQSMLDFDNKVIEMFSSMKTRTMNFISKKIVEKFFLFLFPTLFQNLRAAILILYYKIFSII